jgi:hypothetical protein
LACFGVLWQPTKYACQRDAKVRNLYDLAKFAATIFLQDFPFLYIIEIQYVIDVWLKSDALFFVKTDFF